MWNKLSVSIEKRKFMYFAGFLLVTLLFLGTGKAFAVFPDLDYQGGWWSPNHNDITDNAYMQHAVSRDGYTDIFTSRLKIYSLDPTITVEIFGADLCTNQPSYTTDEFFTANLAARAAMTVSYSAGPATDLLGKIGVEVMSNTPSTGNSSGSYRGAACTNEDSRRVITASSNIYDETLGRYVYSFVASAGPQSGFINGFRIRALGITNPHAGMFISPEAANDPAGGLAAARSFGIEAGYPREDNGNPGASSTYVNFSYPFVPDCGLAASGAARITLYDDDNGNPSLQGNRLFKIRIIRIDVSPAQIIPFTPEFPSGGSASAADGNGYVAISTGDTRYSYLNFNMSQSGTYRLDVLDLFQDNTLQISIPGTAAPYERTCPQPATLDGVKMDSNFGATPYGGNITGPFSGMNTTVAGHSDANNPFYFNAATSKSLPVNDFDGRQYRVRLASPMPAGIQIRGYKICGSNVASCNDAWLGDSNNIVLPSLDGSGFYFDHNFLPGVQYHMRWIFMPTIPVNCAQPPIFSPNNPDTQTTFDFTAGVSHAGYTPVNPRIRLVILNEAKTLIVRSMPDQSLPAGVKSTTFTNIAPLAPGNYWFRWTYQDNIQITTCEHRQPFGLMPYLTVRGGDFLAGGGGIAAGVQSWNRNNDPAPGFGFDYNGAGGELAVLASGDINYFATGRNTWLGAWNPENLAFSNEATSVNLANGLYGGDFEAVPLRPDYYAQASTHLGVIDQPGSIADVSTLASGIHRYTGNITLYGTVGVGKDITVITNGNVLISAAAGPKVAYAPYTSVAQIPRLNVYTRDGDIMVSSGLNEIRGVYSAGRDFYSCAIESPLNAISYNELGVTANNTACSTQLKIYGSVQADELIFSRTRGSYRTAFSPPAEEIIYSPELWLGNSSGSSGSGAINLNSYIGLPPIL